MTEKITISVTLTRIPGWQYVEYRAPRLGEWVLNGSEVTQVKTLYAINVTKWVMRREWQEPRTASGLFLFKPGWIARNMGEEIPTWHKQKPVLVANGFWESSGMKLCLLAINYEWPNVPVNESLYRVGV